MRICTLLRTDCPHAPLLHKLLMRAQIAKSPLTGNSFTHNINGYGPVEGKIMPFICPQSQPTSNRDISREAKNHK